jgi:hypothetical protein
MSGEPRRILVMLAAAQALAGCAPATPPQPAPAAAGVNTAPAGGIPIFRAHKLADCRYRLLRPMIAEDVAGLREQTRMQNGNAVVRLREHTQVREGSRSSTPGSRAIVEVFRFFSATPIRVENPDCLRVHPADA